MVNQPEIKAFDGAQSIAIRSIVPMSELDVGALFGDYATRLVTYLEQHDIEPAGAPYARYREFGPERADVEIGLPVVAELDDLDDLEADDVIGVSELPAGRTARSLHIGPYDRLGETYQLLEKFMAAEGLEPDGAPWESYLLMPHAVDDPAELRTEVCWPVR
jgi:effector-binding domain-containing protein